MSRSEVSRAPDLRMLVLGAATWAGGLVVGVTRLQDTGLIAVVAVMTVSLIVMQRCTSAFSWRSGVTRTLVVAAVLGAAVMVSAVLRSDRLGVGPVAELADQHAEVRVVAVVTSDPRATTGRGGVSESLVHVSVRELSGRGHQWELRAPVLVIGDARWAKAGLGSTVSFDGALTASDDETIAALLMAHGAPHLEREPAPWWRATDHLRTAIRDSVTWAPGQADVLVPALVDGDERGMTDDLKADFLTTGLTHLLAVSGTNLTLILSFLMTLARWCGVRGRWLLVVGGIGVVGFVLLARTEPSVLRAAAMGTVGLLALGRVDHATRALGVAVVGLLLLDPTLATSWGFALSVLATAGLVLIAPRWRDALARWLPVWVAELIAVSAATHLVTVPLAAALSGTVSLVAVFANLVAEPAVAPATILGLAGGLVQLVVPPAAHVVGWVAGLAGWWIISVATTAAGLPGASVGLPVRWWSLGLLTLLALAIALGAPRLLRHRFVGGSVLALLVVVVVVPLPHPGWPPEGWVFVACDVGQGDGLVLRAGEHEAVVIDAGPEPAPMERCLDRLGVHRIDLAVMTHFDADHVTGISGAFAGRTVEQLWVSPVRQPAHGVALVDTAARAARVTPATPALGEVRTLGDVTLQVLAPDPGDIPDSASASNAACIVILARVGGVTLLLTGDLEPEGQEALAARLPGLHVDVLKVPHHGSRFQDEGWLLSLQPRIAVTSVGRDNGYGHPAPSTLDPLQRAGVAVYRTDRDGSVAVVRNHGVLGVVKD